MPLFPSPHQELRLEHAKARLLRETMATSSSSLILAPLSKLKNLYLEAIPDLESLPQLQNLTSLQKLEILSCPKLASMSQDMGRLKCLQHLKIVDCDELISDDSDAMEWGDLGSLQSLNIRGLPKLTSSPKGLQFVTNLQELTINNCASLMALQDWIGNLTSIRSLIISRLTSLPEGMHLLTSLQQLIIYECLKLSVRYIKEKGVDWPRIAHIPNLYTHPPEVAFNIAEQVITKLGSVAFQEIELISGAKDDLKKLENSLTTIKAVLIDAEEKQEKSLAVKSWLRRLQDIVYEADELVDEVATNDLQRMVQAQSQGKVVTQVCNFFSSSNQIWFRSKLGHRVRDIRQKLNEVENEISILHLMKKEIIADVRDKSSGRETSSVVKYDIIGREKDKENMIESLLIPTSQENVSVSAIVGIGGLGKTALAQLVYNDEKVKNYFEKKMWVCVSEDFDVKLLVKKILECATDEEVPNLELEQCIIVLKRS
ncbi:hypothetical protein GH714_034493 [Hevea brasiliensis]|uniref:Rx N-terminal domain-containing protein n=1 Tax=Hevea brasiliensis TaxID=3981 RepID=A0A6A6N9J1_HEVBR|nr:hypothetical protein GH714_034493 [Hevea brasiliensis]